MNRVRQREESGNLVKEGKAVVFRNQTFMESSGVRLLGETNGKDTGTKGLEEDKYVSGKRTQEREY